MRISSCFVSTSSDDAPTLTVASGGDDLAARVARIEALLFGVERWLPVSVVAERLGVARTTVHSWIQRGHDIPARQFGGRWEIDPTWVAEQAATRRTNSPRKD